MLSANKNIQDYIVTKNILLSTTYGWNCGDDFIAFGVRNIINQVISEANFISYNRNPDLHIQRVMHNKIKFQTDQQQFDIDLSKYIETTNWKYDNSWHSRNNLEHVDCCVFAGTPEWFGPMVSPLTQSLSRSDVPVLYLGVGGFERREGLTFEKLSQPDREVLHKAAIVSTRDSQAQKLLSPVGSQRLPCPALLSSEKERVRKPVKKPKVALSTQPDTSLQPPSSAGVYDFTLKLFAELQQEFECEVVCHYIDEIGELSKLGIPVRYSYNADDYFNIYDRYDLVVTTRVHGAGIAASLGIPSFVISHSARSETVEGFLAELIPVDSDKLDETLQRIREFNIYKRSREIVTHKQRTMLRYVDKLSALDL